MAEHKVSGGTMLLFIDPNGGTTYDTVVCLKSVGVSDTINPIDISSWCGSGKLPGLLNISYTYEGYHLQDVASGKISGTDLRILLRNKTTIGWKLSPESPLPGDEIQTGIGFISDLSSTYAFDAAGSFNLTIQVKGNVTSNIQPSYTSTFTFVNDNNDNNYYYFAIFGYSPFVAYINTPFTDESIPSSGSGGSYFITFAGNSFLEKFDVNITIDNPDTISVFDSNGDEFGPGFRIYNLNLYSFTNLIGIGIKHNKLTTSNLNTILYNQIINGNTGGNFTMESQNPVAYPNIDYINTLISRGWSITY